MSFSFAQVAQGFAHLLTIPVNYARMHSGAK